LELAVWKKNILSLNTQYGKRVEFIAYLIE